MYRNQSVAFLFRTKYSAHIIKAM